MESTSLGKLPHQAVNFVALRDATIGMFDVGEAKNSEQQPDFFVVSRERKTVDN